LAIWVTAQNEREAAQKQGDRRALRLAVMLPQIPEAVCTESLIQYCQIKGVVTCNKFPFSRRIKTGIAFNSPIRGARDQSCEIGGRISIEGPSTCRSSFPRSRR